MYTRTTRSQSRALGDTEPPESSALHAPRRPRQGSVESAEGTGIRGGQAAGNTRQGNRSRPKQEIAKLGSLDLPSLAEDADTAYPDLSHDAAKISLEDDQAVHIQLQREAKSPGTMSSISGTTAQTTHSAQELADLDSDIMLDSLPGLWEQSVKILDYLHPPNAPSAQVTAIAKDLQDPGSRVSKILQKLSSKFAVDREEYGNEQYINVSIALRALLKSRHMNEVGIGSWRPDGILQMANIAILLVNWLVAHQKGPIPSHSVEKLERDFPEPFVSGISGSEINMPPLMGNSALSEQTLSTALELRTQFFIALLPRFVEQPDFDLDFCLKEVFFENDSEAVKGWNVHGMQSDQLSAVQRGLILERVKRIRQMIPGDFQLLRDRNFVDGTLRQTFPWSSFITNVTTWCRMRGTEITIQLQAQGGSEDVKKALSDEIQRRNDFTSLMTHKEPQEFEDKNPLIQLNFDPPSDKSDQNGSERSAPIRASRNKSARNSFNTRTAIVHLSNRLKSVKPIPSAQGREYPTAPPNDDQVPSAGRSNHQMEQDHEPSNVIVPLIDNSWPDDDDPILPDKSQSMVKKYLALEKQVEIEKNKENISLQPGTSSHAREKRSLLDRQPNAQRVQFDNSQHLSQGIQGHATLNRHSSPRRVEEEAMPDPSQDDGFQTDERPVAPTRERPKRPDPPTKKASPIKRARRDRTRNDDLEYQNDSEDDNGSKNRGHSPAAVRADLHIATQRTQIEAYREVNSQAKKFTSMRKEKRAQSRMAWTEEETDALIQYIAIHGTSWAKIKEVDEEEMVLQWRDQVALKDKARNIKLDYLKAGVVLPRHFERIQLNNLQMRKLWDLDILYEQEGRRGIQRLEEGQD